MGIARPRTLRARIVASVAVLLLVGFTAVALITTLVVHRVLLDRLDAQLRAAGTRFAVSLERADRDGDNGPSQFDTVAGQATGTLGARAVNGTVTAAAVVGRQDATAALSADARAVLGRLTVDSSPRSIDVPGLGVYRILVASGRDGDQQITGLPYEPVEETTNELVLIEALVFAAAVVLIGAASAGLVGRTLRPLARVADTASRVAALPLASGTVSLTERAPRGPAGSEVETVSAAFNAMLEQVESALTQRHDSEEGLRRFVADASHELRTPVAVVRSQAEYAQRVGGADLPEEVSHALQRITAQSERMSHLVEDLLLLARLDGGRPLADEEVDLTRIVLDSVTDARIAHPDHRWRLDLPDTEVVLAGDERALHQVVTNLLANAGLHTPPGTSVLTTLRATGDATVTLTVGDDGPGIAGGLVDHVFERFVRGGDERANSRGTSGLGLAIVAAIVAAHAGTVSLDSDRTGTRVTVVLPTIHVLRTGG